MQQQSQIEEARIRAKAYELWQSRGCPEGSGDQDWMEAERLLKLEAASNDVAVDRYRVGSRREGGKRGEGSSAPPPTVVPSRAAKADRQAAPTQKSPNVPATDPPLEEQTAPSAGVTVVPSRLRAPVRPDVADQRPLPASQRSSSPVQRAEPESTEPASGSRPAEATSEPKRKGGNESEPVRRVEAASPKGRADTNGPAASPRKGEAKPASKKKSGSSRSR
ncbi:MAG: DUF2934 domain-containing protein [Polyangiaceae bacterium]|nr:DUF2934 domain-containing protein [Polyangiaceae bacterium]